MRYGYVEPPVCAFPPQRLLLFQLTVVTWRHFGLALLDHMICEVRNNIVFECISLSGCVTVIESRFKPLPDNGLESPCIGNALALQE
jgi:hypothetical protein